MIAKDAQECENNKSYIICGNMFTETTNVLQIHLKKKSPGVLTLPSVQKYVIKIQTRELLQKMRKSMRIINHI